MHFPKLALFSGGFGDSGGQFGVFVLREREVSVSESHLRAEIVGYFFKNRVISSASPTLKIAVFYKSGFSVFVSFYIFTIAYGRGGEI